MRIWKSIDEEKPPKSGWYRVRVGGNQLLSIKYAHYDSSSDRWTDDDGRWLPMNVTIYVTYWSEWNDE